MNFRIGKNLCLKDENSNIIKFAQDLNGERAIEIVDKVYTVSELCKLFGFDSVEEDFKKLLNKKRKYILCGTIHNVEVSDNKVSIILQRSCEDLVVFKTYWDKYPILEYQLIVTTDSDEEAYKIRDILEKIGGNKND